MATAWGVDPLKDGNGLVTIGTTALDFRLIQGGIYTPGIINGGVVTRSASALTYTVSAGVAAFPIVTTAPKQTALGAIPYTVKTVTAPSSGTRTDLVYALQRTVADNGDPNIVVEVGTVLPAKAVLLDSYIVSAGQTNTNAAVRTGQIAYSIPYGASLGTLWQIRDTFNGDVPVARRIIGSGTFYVPTDRNVRISATTSVSAKDAVKFDNAKYCESGIEVFIDGVSKYIWTTGGLHQAWEEYHWSESFTATMGSHTVRYETFRAQGPGVPVQRYSVGNAGNLCKIEDIGPAI